MVSPKSEKIYTVRLESAEQRRQLNTEASEGMNRLYKSIISTSGKTRDDDFTLHLLARLASQWKGKQELFINAKRYIPRGHFP